MNLTRRESEILRLIYDMTRSGGIPVVGTSDIAKLLNVAPASVYEILMRLVRDKGLLKKVGRKGFILTERGKRLAEQIIFAHRVLELIFYNYFGLPADCACRVASYIDYMLDVKSVYNAFRKLGLPNKCPHNKDVLFGEVISLEEIHNNISNTNQ